MGARRIVDYIFRVEKDNVSDRFRTLEAAERKMESRSRHTWESVNRTAERSLSHIGLFARRQFTTLADGTLGLFSNKLVQFFTAGGLGLAFKKGFDDLADLGDQMTGIAIKLNRPVESLEDVRRELLAFSQQRGITDTAENMARSINMLVGADFDLASSLQIAKAAAKGAAAAQTDSATVTRGLTTSLKGFKIEAGRSEEILSKMIRATDLGVVEMEDLSNAMVDLVAPSLQAHASLEQVLGMLEALSISGVGNAAEASTSIARMLERFVSPEFRKKALRFGIHVTDEKGNLKSPIEILDLIRRKYQQLDTDVKRGKFIEKITGGEIRAKRALIPLIENLQQAKDSVDEISRSGDRLGQAFEESAKRASATKSKFVNVAKDIDMAFTEGAIPAINRFSELWEKTFPAEQGGLAAIIRKRNEERQGKSWLELIGQSFASNPAIAASVMALAALNKGMPGPSEMELASGGIERLPAPAARQNHPVLLQPKIEVNTTIDGATGRARTDVTVSDPNTWERRVPLSP